MNDYELMASDCKYFESGATCKCARRLLLMMAVTKDDCNLFYNRVAQCEYYEKRKDENV
jgi:hypothetical protein